MRITLIRVGLCWTLVAMMVHSAAAHRAIGLVGRTSSVLAIELACPKKNVGFRFGTRASQSTNGAPLIRLGLPTRGSLHHVRTPSECLLKLDVSTREDSISNCDVVNEDEEASILFDIEDNVDEGEEEGYSTSTSTSSSVSSKLTPGSNDGFFVVKTYGTNLAGFDMEKIKTLVSEGDVDRLDLTATNISVPVALMMLDGDEYTSISRARKACRKANIMIHRGSLIVDPETGKDTFDAKRCLRARVGDRVFPGDIIAKQVRMGDGYFPVMSHKKPPFDLPVVFEDDHFAIVNKPAGVVVYANRKGGHGIMTIRAGLPFAVRPPKEGTYSTLRRPQPVHRLDKPTSGLLIVAKTKPAMVHLSHQFHDRKVKKTYVAILNGIPPEPVESRISAVEAFQLGVDVEPQPPESDSWQVIDSELDEKSAVTIWKALKHSRSLKAKDNYLTLVELKPKTGRYHQLRRHMAWICETPIVGDSDYDGGGTAMQLRDRGLFLCSNRVTLEHPYYNDLGENAEDVYQKIPPKDREHLWVSIEGRVMVTASINIPTKFESFMDHADDRYRKMASN